MTFLKFMDAKRICRQIVKTHKLKNMEDWIKFTASKDFIIYSLLIPKKPWIYYSKKNVEKRSKSEQNN